MNKVRKHKLLSSFLGITLIVTLVAVAVVQVGLWWFSSYMAEYEATQPKHVVSRIMDMYFTAPDYGMWATDALGAGATEFDDIVDYQRYIHGQMEGGAIVSHSRQATFTGEQREYTVYSGNTAFAEFTVAKAAKKSRYGFDVWELQSIRPVQEAFATRVSVYAQVLQGSTLLLNGKQVGGGFLVQDGQLPDSSKDQIPPDIPGLTYDLYHVEGLLYEPEIAAVNLNGSTALLLPDGDVYREVIDFGEVPDDLRALALDALLAYCRLSTNDGSLGTVGRYFDRNAPVWDDILVLNSWLWVYPNHTGYDYEDITISDYYRYNDNAFSVRAKAIQHIYRAGLGTHTYPIDFTMYFARRGNAAFLVYELVSHV